jgi:hypothetical protein
VRRGTLLDQSTQFDADGLTGKNLAEVDLLAG